jgi:hypothetical protein
VIWDKAVDHACDGHVDEGVDPQRRKEGQQDAACCEGGGLLVVCPEGGEDVGEQLPESTHYQGPGVALGQDRVSWAHKCPPQGGQRVTRLTLRYKNARAM